MQSPPAQGTLTIEQVEVMNVAALKNALATRSLAVSGNKTTLKDRLLAAIVA